MPGQTDRKAEDVLRFVSQPVILVQQIEQGHGCHHEAAADALTHAVPEARARGR